MLISAAKTVLAQNADFARRQKLQKVQDAYCAEFGHPITRHRSNVATPHSWVESWVCPCGTRHKFRERQHA